MFNDNISEMSKLALIEQSKSSEKVEIKELNKTRAEDFGGVVFSLSICQMKKAD